MFVFAALFAGLVCRLLHLFFHTEIGAAMSATGDNPLPPKLATQNAPPRGIARDPLMIPENPPAPRPVRARRDAAHAPPPAA